MSKTHALLLPFLLLALMGCVSSPPVEVLATGAPLLKASGPVSLGAFDEPSPAEVQARSAVLKSLADRGWIITEEASRWRIEVAYSERPSQVGGFTEEAAPDDPQTWRTRAMGRRWWKRTDPVRTLTLRVLDLSTGAELARSTATQRVTREPTERTLERLADAVVDRAMEGANSAGASVRQPR